MKDIKQFINGTRDLAGPLKQGFLATIHDYEKRLVKMSKEEALDFATKYLKDRVRKDVWGDPTRDWEIAVEYILLDIIPYIYGEALD